MTTGPEICADCGTDVPAGTPPYPADMYGTGRLCRACAAQCSGWPNDLTPCADCPGAPLFARHEIPEHREITHGGPSPAAD